MNPVTIVEKWFLTQLTIIQSGSMKNWGSKKKGPIDEDELQPMIKKIDRDMGGR